MIRHLLAFISDYRIRSLFIFITSVFISISVISYDAIDPAFSVAAMHPPLNWAGYPGAYVADFMLQTFGLSATLPITFSMIFSVRMLFNRDNGNWWLKTSSMLFVMLCSASWLTMLPHFDLPFNNGGIIGIFLLQLLSQYQHIFLIISIPSVIIAIIYICNLQISQLFNGEWRSTADISNDDYPTSIARSPTTTEPIERETKKTASPTPSPLRRILSKTKSEGPLPDIALLSKSHGSSIKMESRDKLAENASHLADVLADFGIKGSVLDVSQGPVVTTYELEPAAGTKSSRVIGLSDDIARSLSAVSTRISVVPGRNILGIELPNKERAFFGLREIVESAEYKNDNITLPLILGKNINGKSTVADLAKMPHLLVAGTTGSGKSVAINTMILSLLYKFTPEECRFIMIDPKMLELSIYDNIPHLLTPVVTEPGKAITSLKWAVKEMENRYRLMANINVRNISGYNDRIAEAVAKKETITRRVQTGFDPETGKPIYEVVELDMEKLPYIVIIVDEMADLMLVAGKDIEASIQRLAQMARAAGIHLIMATQRPSVDVITGVIKANFPSRISFKVTSKIDSRTILGEQGAEQLLGMGDMLYMGTSSLIERIHGPFVSDKEVESVTNYLRSCGEPNYVTSVTKDEEDDGASMMDSEGSGDDDLYRQAVNIVRTERKASTSYIQRSLRIGYNRAAILVERMEKEGILSEPNHSGKREILLPE